MPRGGRRVGSGRKPKAKNVLEFPGGGSAPAGVSATAPAGAGAAAPDVAALAEPPADLLDTRGPGDLGTLTHKAAWRLYAPLAIEQRTLVPATVPGFRELCELLVFKEELAARVAKFGSDGKIGAERIRTYTRLSQRLDATLGRFKLTAFGKPADGSSKKEPGVNPWAQVAGQ